MFNCTELLLWECSTDWTTNDKFDGLLLGDWLGSVDGHSLDTNEGTELGSYSGKVPGKIIWASEEATLGTYEYTEKGLLECFTGGTEDGKFNGLLMWARLRLVYGIKLVTDKVTELGYSFVKRSAQYLDQFPLGVYDGRELGSWEGFTNGFLNVKYNWLLLWVWFWSFDGIKFGPNEGIWLGKLFGDLERIIFGKYDWLKLKSP